MFEGLIANTLAQVEVVESLIETHDDYISKQPSERQRLVRVFTVTSCVTRLYAIYEHFIETVISDYLDAVPELVPYTSLPEQFRNEYRLGISYVLSRIDGERYSHLSHKNVVLWYHEALTSAAKYRFVVEALTRHDQNLRLPTVESLLGRLDLRDLRAWLAHAPAIVDLYEDRNAVFEQVEAELKAFVQLRDDATHGVLESLEGKEILLRYCALVKALTTSIAAYFHKTLLMARAKVGRMKKIGEVTEVFSGPGAFVAQLETGSEVRLGMSVHFVGNSYCIAQPIESIKVEDAAVEYVVADKAAFEVGMKCPMIPRRHTEIFIDSLPAAAVTPAAATTIAPVASAATGA